MRILFLTIAVLFSTAGLAKEKSLGLGLAIGHPTGLGIKYWINNTNALDSAIGIDDGDIELRLDYLWHANGFIKIDKLVLDAFYGFGGRLKERGRDRDTVFGLRGPIGLRHYFLRQNIELAFMVALGLDFSPEADMNLQPSFVIRYFF
jgi:hypothetical protein